MESLLRKLQEVKDLATSTGTGAAESGGQTPAAKGVGQAEAASDLPAGVTEDSSREELLAALRSATREVTSLKLSLKSLREEAQSQQDEFSAYKTKVNTWREQMKAARAQDRKTIDALREAQGAGPSSSSGDGSGGSESIGAQNNSNAAYVNSLEEQVKMLKESLREQADERDRLKLELSKVRQRVQQQASEPSASLPSGSNSATPSDGGNEMIVAGLRTKIEELEDAVRDATRRAEKAEANLVAAEDQADASQRALAAALETHRTAMDRLSETNESAKLQKYVRELEQELKGWRAETSRLENEVSRLQAQLERESGGGGSLSGHSSSEAPNQAGAKRSSNEAFDSMDTPTRQDASGTNGEDASAPGSPASPLPPATQSTLQTGIQLKSAETIQQLTAQLAAAELKIAQLTDKIRAKDEVISKIDAHLSDMSVEVRAREEAINEMYEENKTLRTQSVEVQNRYTQQYDQLLAKETEVAHLREDLKVLESQVEEVADAHAVTKKSLTSLQAELSTRNETIRQLRNELGQTKSQLLRQQQLSGAVVNVPSSSSGAANSASATAGAAGSNTPGSPSQPLDLTLQQYALKIMSTSKFRSYSVAIVVFLLILVFTFYQSTTIVESSESTGELLKSCREQLKAWKEKSSV